MLDFMCNWLLSGYLWILLKKLTEDTIGGKSYFEKLLYLILKGHIKFFFSVVLFQEWTN